MSDNSSPGVRVVEDHSLQLSVNHSETAVPAFLCSAEEFKLLVDVATGKPLPPSVRFTAWLDILKRVKAAQEKKARKQAEVGVASSDGKAAGDVEKSEKKLLNETYIYSCLQAYFENGGGPCYILNGVDTHAIGKIKTLPDVTLLVQAGVGTPGDVSRFCESNRDVFGLTDTDIEESGDAPSGTVSSEYAAAYSPALKRIPPTNHIDKTAAVRPTVDQNATPVLIPASAVMAGIYCRVDRERGVWKAPANVQVHGGLVLSKHIYIKDEKKSSESFPSINIIRAVSDQAPVVWGARTLASAAQGAFKYVPVRRLFNAIQKDVKATLSIAVFETNSPPTWERVRGAIDNYLHALWKRGALVGETSEEAYLVQVGLGVTMTDADLKNGEMIVKVALAPSRPAEFVLLEFSQKVGLG